MIGNTQEQKSLKQNNIMTLIKTNYPELMKAFVSILKKNNYKEATTYHQNYTDGLRFKRNGTFHGVNYPGRYTSDEVFTLEYDWNDAVKSIKQIPKFEVGDVAVIVNAHSTSYNVDGEIRKVECVDDVGRQPYKLGYCRWEAKENIRKATPEEVEIFEAFNPKGYTIIKTGDDTYSIKKES